MVKSKRRVGTTKPHLIKDSLSDIKAISKHLEKIAKVFVACDLRGHQMWMTSGKNGVLIYKCQDCGYESEGHVLFCRHEWRPEYSVTLPFPRTGVRCFKCKEFVPIGSAKWDSMMTYLKEKNRGFE